MALFVIAFAVGFSATMATLVIVCLVVSFVLLAPSIVLGYAVKAADRETPSAGCESRLVAPTRRLGYPWVTHERPPPLRRRPPRADPRRRHRGVRPCRVLRGVDERHRRCRRGHQAGALSALRLQERPLRGVARRGRRPHAERDHEGDRRRRRRARADRPRLPAPTSVGSPTATTSSCCCSAAAPATPTSSAIGSAAITDEAAAAIAPLIAVDIDPEHRDTLAHALGRARRRRQPAAGGARRELRSRRDRTRGERPGMGRAARRAAARPERRDRRRAARVALARQTPDMPLKKRRRGRSDGDAVRPPSARHRRLRRCRGRSRFGCVCGHRRHAGPRARAGDRRRHARGPGAGTARLAATSGSDLAPTELAEARSPLRTVDAEGNEIMQQLDLLGVDLTNATRAALAPLPNAGDPSAGRSAAAAAPAGRLRRRDRRSDADRRHTELPRHRSTNHDGGGSFGLLAVAAAALLALGLAALANTLAAPRTTRLAAMAWSDGLTGVANRRRLDRDLAAHATAATGPTAVIMVDVDHFKQVNDTTDTRSATRCCARSAPCSRRPGAARRRRVPLRRRGVLHPAARGVAGATPGRSPTGSSPPPARSSSPTAAT